MYCAASLMKKKSEPSNEITGSNDPGWQCQHCDRRFQRESSLLTHVCEQGRRHLERDEVGVQIGLQAYRRFYEITQGSARNRDWDSFSGSAYYRAFVKFGRYCQAIRAVSVPRFIEWLVRGNRKIDHWCQDRVYTEYLLEHVRREPAMDALERAIEHALTWQETTGYPVRNYLRHESANSLCHAVTSGRITAWCLYNCDSGQEALGRFNPEQISMIWPWIDADFWDRRFRDFPADSAQVREMLTQMGW